MTLYVHHRPITKPFGIPKNVKDALHTALHAALIWDVMDVRLIQLYIMGNV